MLNQAKAIHTSVAPILAYLRSITGEDCEKAQRAVHIIQGYLDDTTLTVIQLQIKIDYSMGGKGMMDWNWSNRAKLESILQEHWWSKRISSDI